MSIDNNQETDRLTRLEATMIESIESMSKDGVEAELRDAGIDLPALVKRLGIKSSKAALEMKESTE